MQQITLRQPDDWHVHLRDGAALSVTVPHISRYFHRAIVMPNLVPPVNTVALALQYRDRILKHVHPASKFQPLMALYLTDTTSTEEVKRAADDSNIIGFKLYPAGATTHSDAGVTSLTKISPILENLEKLGVPLLIHGEVTDPSVDVFDRESYFIERELQPLVKHFPRLKVVLEHITTSDAVDFISAASDNVAATVTAHHLLYERSILFAGGIKPHYYCLPVLKRRSHQKALIEAVTSGSAKFFLGTDSAPHARGKKEAACGCAGIYTAHAAIELYAEVFEAAGALDKLEQFASINGPQFYGLPVNERSITLEKKEQRVPEQFVYMDDVLVPLRAGEFIGWQVI